MGDDAFPVRSHNQNIAVAPLRFFQNFFRRVSDSHHNRSHPFECIGVVSKLPLSEFRQPRLDAPDQTLFGLRPYLLDLS